MSSIKQGEIEFGEAILELPNKKQVKIAVFVKPSLHDESKILDTASLNYGDENLKIFKSYYDSETNIRLVITGLDEIPRKTVTITYED